MTSSIKIAEYLTKAEDADRQAELAKTLDDQTSLKQIAARYRDFAMMVENTSRLLKVRPSLRR